MTGTQVQTSVPQPEITWPPVPLLGEVRYIQHGLRTHDPQLLAPGSGPMGTLAQSASVQHPFTQPPVLDPLLAQVFQIVINNKDGRNSQSVTLARAKRLAFWAKVSTACEKDIPA